MKSLNSTQKVCTSPDGTEGGGEPLRLEVRPREGQPHSRKWGGKKSPKAEGNLTHIFWQKDSRVPQTRQSRPE